MIRNNIIYFEVESPQYTIHIFHNIFRVMPAAIFVNSTTATYSLMTAAPVGAPSPGQFWALMVWVIIPITLVIWMVYFQQKERLRKIQRRLRQLEARLCPPPRPEQTAIRVAPAFSATLPPRPSSLTARILISPSPNSPPPFSQPIVGSGQ